MQTYYLHGAWGKNSAYFAAPGIVGAAGPKYASSIVTLAPSRIASICLRAIFRPQLLFDFRLHFRERLRFARFHLDDVETERGLHRFADFADLQREGSLFKRGRRRAALERTQIAALCATLRIVGFGLCDLTEIFAAKNALANVLRLLSELLLR
jgi:hypothetical protein